MSKHGAFITGKALAWWGGSAVLIASTAVTGLLVSQSSAAPYAGTVAGTTSSAGNGQGGGNNGNGVGNGPGGAQPAVKSLIVDELVSGLVRPGLPATVTISVINPNNQPVILTGVATSLTVTPVSGKTCSASDFRFAPATGLSRRLEKAGASNLKDRTTVNLTLEMRDTTSNQDGCKSAALDFTYAATANQA